MASNRADKYTQTAKIPIIYSDFFNNFERHPVTNSLAIVTNAASVTQSIRNLIKTNVGERLFQPTVGSDIFKSLFEPNDVVTATNIRFFVINTITAFEPRANLLEVSVGYSPDGYIFTVNILYSLVNIAEPIPVTVIINRVR